MNIGKLLSVVFVGTVLVSACTTSGTDTPVKKDETSQTSTVSSSVVADDWIKGAQISGLSIVEYSDFQCPACGAYYPLVKQLMDEFGDRIRFAYRQFPLRSIHPNADIAARAAESAGKQGSFWEMHDLIFENQREWSEAKTPTKIFSSYAKRLGLDTDRFERDISSQEIKDAVEADYKSGIQLQVNYTPTFFIDGKKIKNPRTYEELKALVQASLDKL